MNLYQGYYQPSRDTFFLWFTLCDGTITALFHYTAPYFKLPKNHYMIRNKKTGEYWYGSFGEIKKTLEE
jgi:hypothetical protein